MTLYCAGIVCVILLTQNYIYLLASPWFTGQQLFPLLPLILMLYTLILFSFSHACITCFPNSSLLQESFSLSRVLAIRPSVIPSFQNLPRMRLFSCLVSKATVCMCVCTCIVYVCVCPHVSVTLVWWEVVITHHLLETQMDTGTTTTTAPAK